MAGAAGRTRQDGDGDGDEELSDALRRMALSLVREKRFVEAVTLGKRLARLALGGRAGTESCTLLLKLCIALGEHQEQQQDDTNAAHMAQEYLRDGLELAAMLHEQLLLPEEELKEEDQQPSSADADAALDVVAPRRQRRLIPGSSRTTAELRELYAGMQTRALASLAALERQTDQEELAEATARRGLEAARRGDRGKLLEPQPTLAVRQQLHAEAKCHLLLCTLLSGKGKHDQALKHARAGAALLGAALPVKGEADGKVLRCLGIAYYNVGAELEHLAERAAGANPGEWYRKALSLARQHPAAFSQDMKDAFATTHKSFLEQQQQQLRQPPPLKEGPKQARKKSNRRPRSATSRRRKSGSSSGSTPSNANPANVEVSDADDEEVGDDEEVRLRQRCLLLVHRLEISQLKVEAEVASLGPRPSVGKATRWASRHLPREDAAALARGFARRKHGVVDVHRLREALELARPPAPELTPPQGCLELLADLLAGKEAEAAAIFAGKDRQGREAKLSAGQVVEALEWLGLELSVTQRARLFDALNRDMSGMLPVADLLLALGVEPPTAAPPPALPAEPQVDECEAAAAAALEPLEPLEPLLHWEAFDPVRAEEELIAKLDELDRFDLDALESQAPLEQPKRRSAAPALDARAGTGSGYVRRQQRQEDKEDQGRRAVVWTRPATRQAAAFTEPVPMSVAGWRLYRGEAAKAGEAAFEHGRWLQWPPMVRARELDALLEGPPRPVVDRAAAAGSGG